MVRVYKMEYVDLSECRDYYRRNDVRAILYFSIINDKLWQTHV